jgi:hypothetical protein
MSKKPFKPRKCDSINCSHIANSKPTYYLHQKTCKIRMADYTQDPGYKLLMEMIACKRKEKVKSLWTTQPQLHTNLRICSAKFKEVKMNRIQ